MVFFIKFVFNDFVSCLVLTFFFLFVYTFSCFLLSVICVFSFLFFHFSIFFLKSSLSSILGWILVCIGIHEENQNGRRLLIHCSSLRTDLDTQKVRLQNMSGKHLDSASPDELEDLVVIQRAAVKSTERAIEFYRKRTEARGGRASPKKGIGSFGSPAKV